eukprot:1398979-Amphidinium_carterae.1
MNVPHMPTIHENARVDPLMVDDPWSRDRNANLAAGMSIEDDLTRSRSRQLHGHDRNGLGSGLHVPVPTTTYDIYTPREDVIMPQARMTAHPTYQTVSHPPGFPQTIPSTAMQQHVNMDVESGMFRESEPQMWYPPSTHQQGCIQGRQQRAHFPVHDQGQSPIFSMEPPEPRPMTQDGGFQMSPIMSAPRVQSIPMGTQRGPDPFDFQTHGGGQGSGNQLVMASNRVNNPQGQSQPREAS